MGVTHPKTRNLSQLHKIFQRDGEDGLKSTFSQKNFEGQARVSSKKQILDLFPRICGLFFVNMKIVLKNDIVTN